MVDLNGTQAAIRAGYSKRSAREIARENLIKPLIASALYQRLSEKRRETELSEKWVLDRLEEIAERCMQARPVLDSKGNQKFTETANGRMVPAYTFDSSGANRSVELIGKHFATFIDRVQHTGEIGIKRIERVIVDPKEHKKAGKKRSQRI